MFPFRYNQHMVASETSLLVIAAAQALVLIVLLVVAIAILPRLGPLARELNETLRTLRATLGSLDSVMGDIRDRRVVEKLLVALSSASGAVDPLASDFKATMANARDLMDDATQTSQSVRQRIDDLAATQAELNALVKSLTDVSCELRDNELARKLTNVLSDTSLLAADLGILTENANSYLETGKPLVSNVASVVSNARERASGISGSIGGIKDGIKSGRRAWGGRDGK